MKKINISRECIGCGVCFGSSPFFIESANGMAEAKDGGVISDTCCNEVEEIINECPVGAISLEIVGMTQKQGKEGIKELKKIITEKISAISIQMPGRESYAFTQYDCDRPYIGASSTGENRYDYKSHSRAEAAGKRAFKSYVYSQKRAFIQRNLVEYKYRKLNLFNTYSDEEENYYFEINRKVEELLKQFEIEVREKGAVKLPDDFSEFQPKLQSCYINGPLYQLKNIEQIDIVDRISNRIPSSDSYYIDTDDDYDDRCCYIFRDAFEDFWGDIVYESQDIVDEFVENSLRDIIKGYREAFEAELKRKMEHINKV